VTSESSEQFRNWSESKNLKPSMEKLMNFSMFDAMPLSFAFSKLTSKELRI